MRIEFLFLIVICLMFMLIPSSAEEIRQHEIPYMQDWPTLPEPYRTRDWTDTARKVILLTLDGQADSLYFPVSSYFQQDIPLSGGAAGQQFGVQTYLRSTTVKPAYGEAVAQLSAILTASLTQGVNPRELYGMDFVQMAQAYFSRTPDGRGFVSNNSPVDDCAGSFWYTLYPTCLYFHLAAQYPEDAVLEGHMREVAETWLDALGHITTWDAQGFSLKDRQLYAGNHDEPEGILGAAYVMLMAHRRFGDQKFLDAAISLMQQAAERTENPYYEILGSYAPYTAARLNAEENAGLPLARMLDWVFNDGSQASRQGWGVIDSRWGEYDAYGLSGSLTDTGGYAFSMNTFVTAGALAPVARYAPQYSKALGQYLTAAASNSHMFFADGLPAELQDDADYVAQTGLTYLVYEGVRNQGKTTPYATGDAKTFAPGVEGTNFSFYSSGAIGMLSSMIHQTNVPEILCFDLLKTDFEHAAAYPTYLLYNPLTEQKDVCMTLAADGTRDVYDVVSGRYLGRNVSGNVTFCMLPDTAVQAVVLPAGAVLEEQDGCLMAEGTVVRYPAAWVELPGTDEYAFLREGDELPLAVVLPHGDEVTAYQITLNGQEIASGTALPSSFRLELPGGGEHRCVLNVVVDTAQGRHLTCSRSVQVLHEGMTELLRLEGKELTKAFPRMASCKTYPEDHGIRLKVSGDSFSFRLSRLSLQADQDAVMVLKVRQASARWGVQLYINNTATTHVLQTDVQRDGEFIIPLNQLLQTEGLGQAYVYPIFTIATGSGRELTIEYLTVYAQQE